MHTAMPRSSSSNHIDDGAYFIKVLAENEFGDILNNTDDFKEIKIQQAGKKN